MRSEVVLDGKTPECLAAERAQLAESAQLWGACLAVGEMVTSACREARAEPSTVTVRIMERARTEHRFALRQVVRIDERLALIGEEG